MRKVSGTLQRMYPVTQLFAMSVDPTPIAKQPRPPECGPGLNKVNSRQIGWLA